MREHMIGSLIAHAVAPARIAGCIASKADGTTRLGLRLALSSATVVRAPRGVSHETARGLPTLRGTAIDYVDDWTGTFDLAPE